MQRAILTFYAVLGVLAFMLLIYLWAIPNIHASNAISLVKKQEAAFISQAMRSIEQKQYQFLGWDTQVFDSKLVLVTFTYRNPAAGNAGYLAVWWAVRLDEGKVTRVTSMASFADENLLKNLPFD